MPVCCPAQAPPQYTIATVAGQLGANGNYAGDGGPATNALLWGPSDVIVDAAGNVYFTDTNNQRVREVTSSGGLLNPSNGIINTFAGNGTAGYLGDGSAAINAEFDTPTGLRFDNHANLYIADADNAVIREINASGIISTVAGDNTLGFGFAGDLGPATGAQLSNPSGVAVDSAGNIYIADPDNNVVRVVCANQAPVACKNVPAGDINTLAGNQPTGASYTGDGGPAIDALLNDPVAVAVDAAGNLYISDSGNNAIRKVNTSGIINTVAGMGPNSAGHSGDGGPATMAELNAPKSISLDPYGNLYIADSNNSKIRVVEPDGTITTIAGSGTFGINGDGGSATSAQLYFPSGMAFSAGQVYIADNGNNAIRVLTPEAPQINAGGVITAAAFGASATVAPGSWIEIYGANLGVGARTWGTADFNGSNAPASLDSTSVTVGGQSAFVSYISSGQVNVQVPLNVAAGTQPLVLKTAFGTAAAYNLTVGATPGVYAPSILNIGGKQYAGALFANSSTWVLPTGAVPGLTSQPASPGDIITLYGVGFGAVTPAVAAGQLVPPTELTTLNAPVQVLFGTTAATLQYQGLAPDFVGLYQLNIIVPQVAAGDAVPLAFSQGGVNLPQTLYTAVGN